MKRSGLAVWVLATGLATVHGLTAQADTTRRAQVLVRAGRLVATRTGTVLTNQAILVEADRIKEGGSADAVAGPPAPVGP